MSELILLTGATGYVGSRLLDTLIGERRPVRCIARRPEAIEFPAGSDVEVVRGDVLDPESLHAAMEGVDIAYYLVHGMGAGGDYRQLDRVAAENFALAAREAGVRLIVYLGGLGIGDDLSPHLASRQEVGRILRESGVTTIELQASVVIGSGGLSFEMIRALVERLPVMITPRWVTTTTQPIGIDDAIAYLAQSSRMRPRSSTIYQIGGADRVSYRDLMMEYARQRGLRRLILTVPVLTPRLSSLWLRLVTPVEARVGRELIEGLRNATIVRDDSATRDFDVKPIGVNEAVSRALESERVQLDASPRLLSSSSTIQVDCGSAQAFRPIVRIGGRDHGWYACGWLWRLRGFVDRLLGGVGLRRDRRDPEALRLGDVVGFWHVERYEPDHLLRLAADMKLPGHAWLEFTVEEQGGRSTIRQTAAFDPRGVGGRLYWYGLYPLHALVFSRMLEGIARAAR